MLEELAPVTGKRNRKAVELFDASKEAQKKQRGQRESGDGEQQDEGEGAEEAVVEASSPSSSAGRLLAMQNAGVV